MAEAVAALSLAANILQMLDHGRHFVAAADDIWATGEEAIEGLSSLQTLSTDLDDVLVGLQATGPLASRSELSAGNLGIVELAAECTKVTGRMLETLRKVGPPGKAHGRKRGAVKTAFKQLWNNDEIKASNLGWATFGTS